MRRIHAPSVADMPVFRFCRPVIIMVKLSILKNLPQLSGSAGRLSANGFQNRKSCQVLPEIENHGSLLCIVKDLPDRKHNDGNRQIQTVFKGPQPSGNPAITSPTASGVVPRHKPPRRKYLKM